MRRLLWLHVFLPLRVFFLAEVSAELVALRLQVSAQTKRLDELTGSVKNIEQVLLAMAVTTDEARKPQARSRPVENEPVRVSVKI